jgi:5'-deoxynucleotidase YfbR-like HD superfamily hydrolase
MTTRSSDGDSLNPLATGASEQDNEAVAQEVAMILWSARLASLRRFKWQPYWEGESAASDKALMIEDGLPLEDVASHSWKVADMVLLLHYHRPELDRGYCVELAVLHDKLELLTGDYSPIDSDGTGATTHAFNEQAAADKRRAEHLALDYYLERLPVYVRRHQEEIIKDAIDLRTPEALFVNALDKLSALAFVIEKKKTGLKSQHLRFTQDYSRAAVMRCPELLPHHKLLSSLLSVETRCGG